MANAEHVWLVLNDGIEWNRLMLTATPMDIRGAQLSGAILTDRRFIGTDLTGVNLENAMLHRAEFNEAKLCNANMVGAVLFHASLVDCDLSESNFTGANLQGAEISYSHLVGTRLGGARLGLANIRNARLVNTDFGGAVTDRTVWGDLDLRGARNLEQLTHEGPSLVGLDTVIRSAGQIPDIFLRGCGVPDEIIAYILSLGQSKNPVQLYSCFISYSSKDQEFCQRLHNDLQAAGVRCWFAPEDLKIGDRFRDEIESAIRLQDKLLLVLSDSSVNSEWVQTEVESALEREQRQHAQVLFPVRLDDAVMDTPQAWAADVRRKRHMGDFTGWKDYGQYKRAFERLLRDLRAKPISA